MRNYMPLICSCWAGSKIMEPLLDIPAPRRYYDVPHGTRIYATGPSWVELASRSLKQGLRLKNTTGPPGPQGHWCLAKNGDWHSCWVCTMSWHKQRVKRRLNYIVYKQDIRQKQIMIIVQFSNLFHDQIVLPETFTEHPFGTRLGLKSPRWKLDI